MTVKQKQCLLYYLGYYVGSIDGDWGTLSKTATKAFQKDYGLEVDGIFGDATAKAAKHAVTYGMPEKEEPITTSDWWDGIKHFKKAEFACKCGGKYCNGYPAEMKKTIVKVADDTREHFGSEAIVSSGLRCDQHNANVGGVSNSRHKYGKAIDFCIVGKTSAQVLSYVQKRPGVRYAYAIDGSFVHADCD